MPLLRSLACAGLIASLAVAGHAQTPGGKEAGVTLRGYVVDAMCARSIVKKTDVMARAAKHTRACNLDEGCAANGYGVFADGRWYKFDAAGDALAHPAITASTKSRDLLFEVTGTVKADTLHVRSVREVAGTPVPGGKGR
jgi:hypothetical protein